MDNTPEITVFHLDRAGIRQVLGDLEAEIMELIWVRPDDQETTVRDIFETLYERRHLAYTTVMSTMSRLAKKGILRAEKDEHTYIYYPRLTQKQFMSHIVGRVLEGLLLNFAGEDHTPPDPHLVERVRRLYNEIAHRKMESQL